MRPSLLAVLLSFLVAANAAAAPLLRAGAVARIPRVPASVSGAAAPAKSAPSVLAPVAAADALAPLIPAAGLAPGAPAPVAAAAAEKRGLRRALRDALRIGADDAGKAPDGESAARAAEEGFNAAAGFGPLASASEAGSATAAPAADLKSRLLKKVLLWGRADAGEQAALERALDRLLELPTGRAYAERYVAEGLPAQIHFEEFPESRLVEEDGVLRFWAANAFTPYRPGFVEVKLNRHYLDGDPGFLKRSLPAVLGHELFGHGLGTARAIKEKFELDGRAADGYAAYFHHELNETQARLLGWVLDHEDDGRIEDGFAQTYQADPARYAREQKQRLPYYAVTFSAEEMKDPVAALKTRLAEAEASIAALKDDYETKFSYTQAVEHFVENHGLAEARVVSLRRELAGAAASAEVEYANALAVADAVRSQLKGLEGEPDGWTIRYLQTAIAKPFFQALAADAERLARTFMKIRVRHPDRPAPAPAAAAERLEDQLTLEELLAMHADDVAKDAERETPHWQAPPSPDVASN